MVKQHIGLITRIFEWTLNHVLITTIILYILITVPLLVAYIIMYAVSRMRENVDKLLHHKITNRQLISGYLSFVFFSIFLFTILYLLMNYWGLGHLRYGSCIDNSALLSNDPLMVKSIAHHAYFSAITFFTVGYGDICPMGWSKLISVLNSLIGSMFNVLIVALAIINYSRNGE